MSEYDNTNRGALFKNTDKKADNHPDYKGSINVGGVDYWLSAWLKESKDGKKYMSLSCQPKDEKPAKPAKRGFNDEADDVPF